MTPRLLPAIGFVLALAIFFLYVSPTYSGSIAETKAAISRIDSALDAAKNFKEKENQLASAKNAISEENLSKLDAFLPTSVDNVRVILDLTALASRTGLQLSSINVNQPSINTTDSAPPPVGYIDLLIQAVGTYQSFHAFMAGVEQSARLLDPVQILITGSETGAYLYSMSVRLYWLR
jgi:Tfp pilus assembly protein PilO